MTPKIWKAVLVGLVLTLASAAPGGAETPPARVVLVLDASGSMWGQIGGEPKIEIARRVIRELLADWDPAVELGLTAYGHRREGDCADIESLIAPGKVDPARMIAAVEGLNPRGKTPLSDAVIAAARQLRYTENRATVILVSDGIETCDRDPCAVARELEAAGADFTAYVIGFDVSEEQALAQLRCLAENTGGDFTLARDAGSLKAALGRAVRRSRISLRALEVVFSGNPFEVEWSGPDAQGDKIVVVPKEAPAGTPGEGAPTAGGSPARLTAPATTGPHEVRYVSGAGETLLALEITVRASGASLSAPASVGAGSEIEVAWTGPDEKGDRIALVPAAEPDERYFTGRFSSPTSAGSPVTLQAFSEPGDYELRYLATRGAEVLARRPIEIAPAAVTLAAPESVEAGAEFELYWTGPAARGDRIALVEPSAAEGTYTTKSDFGRTATAADNPLRLTAYSTPGVYEIRYIAGADGKTLAKTSIEVAQSSARLEVPSRAPAGQPFEVRWSGPAAKGDRIVLVKASTPDGSYFTSSAYARPTSAGSPLTLTAFAEPGACEVRYLAEGDGKTLARAAVEVYAGE